MDKAHYTEMLEALGNLEAEGSLTGKRIYLFGHCDATENLANVLLDKGYKPIAILDNNKAKHGKNYKEIKIVPPNTILDDTSDNTIVCIVARAYAAMSNQLKKIGYKGQVRKLVDYNSYADYSLSDETIIRMKQREADGEQLLDKLVQDFPDALLLLCPFSALGDIYIMMSYLPAFLKSKNIDNCVVCVVGQSCAEVVDLFGNYSVKTFTQKSMDKIIQAAIYTQNPNVFIPHQDRPYVVDLFKALYIKKIPLEQIYCCGVFGLSKNTKAVKPTNFSVYPSLDKLPKGKSVILSPYAKSVTALPDEIWNQIVNTYLNNGYSCYTNVVEDEQPLKGTIPISPKIAEVLSVVEWAGTFIGIRSGLCDVIRTARAAKYALYPDYNYCDTKWKSIDMYAINGWNNIVIHKETFEWKIN